jgi:ABC-type bacteriocin/lantibiotic exporter with double-glycine peptidase domain
LFIILLSLFNSAVEVIGLAFILPVIYLIKSPEKVSQNNLFKSIYQKLYFLNSEEEFVIFLVTLLPVVFIVKNIISVYISFLQNKFVNNTAVEQITFQYKQALNKKYIYFKEENSNFILRDIATIPTDFAIGVLLPLINLLTEIFVMLFIIVGVAIYSFKVFCLLILILSPVIIIFYNSIKNKIEKMGNEVNNIRAGAFKTIFEAIFGIEDVKLYNKENYFINRSIMPLSYLHNIYTKLNVLKAIPVKLIETTAVISIVIIFYSLNNNPNSSEKLISILIVFATASFRLLPSLNRIMSSLIDIKNKKYVFDILKDFDFDSKKENKIITENICFNQSINIKNISFQYSKNENLIQELNIKIKKGETTGIIGESGSGKSTLLRIILGFLNPSYGKILIDEVELNESNFHLFRKKIGLVQQDFYLLDSSIAENIAFGEEQNEINFAKLSKVIKQAKLDNLITKLPKKEFTKIGEFGSNLSGGQKQRIAIARALYKNAEILLFDEATSSLDNDTEKEIIETLKEIKDNNLTIIMIAHRTSSLKYCDNIYEMKNGKIVNEYSYEQLLNS